MSPTQDLDNLSDFRNDIVCNFIFVFFQEKSAVGIEYKEAVTDINGGNFQVGWVADGQHHVKLMCWFILEEDMGFLCPQ